MREYFEGLENYPLLKPAEEREYLTRAQAGDIEARNYMVCCNARLVITAVQRHCSEKHHNASDLMTVGIMGLMHAIEKFDLSTPFRFSTYALWWINQRIQNHYDFICKDSAVLRTRSMQFEAAMEEMDRENITPTPAILADKLGWSKTWVQSFQPKRGLAKKISEEADLPDERPITQVFADECNELICKALMKLKPLESHIIIHRFGIGGIPAQTFTEISHFLHMSKERVRQIQRFALRRIFVLLLPVFKDIDILF